MTNAWEIALEGTKHLEPAKLYMQKQYIKRMWAVP